MEGEREKGDVLNKERVLRGKAMNKRKVEKEKENRSCCSSDKIKNHTNKFCSASNLIIIKLIFIIIKNEFKRKQ